ncbi:adenylate/guanylate cyclase domain-containing protein [Geminisphaera colitermitum]|uniref:adenylate/guanylate cyclase domain-containing protein n=1 Tax=Geminisphaera colitermitum TaxID=1148786 RepID=UPI0012FF2E05|nr:adenylate/guanylate cyclase domain-containing protein [Geminisphaera colitermitum]
MLVVGLVALVQGGTYWAVVHANRKNASARIEQNMDDGVLHFKELMATRQRTLLAGAGLIGEDLALRDAIARDDRRAMRHVLDHYVRRLNIAGMALLSAGGEFLSASPELPNEAVRTLLSSLVRNYSEGGGGGEGGAAAPVWVLAGNELLAVLVVSVDSPQTQVPKNIRLVVAHRIDRSIIGQVEQLTRLTLSMRLPNSTLTTGAYENASSGPLLTRTLSIPLLNSPAATLLLQRSLDEELEPVRWLEHLLAVTFATSVGAAVLLAVLLARSVSRPVQALARHTRVIASGDYATRIPWKRADELGHLADALNAMSDGLAERDQVRDLLNKNVSPEVASRLLRDGAVLRGEERTVTIMFVDLRGFTTLSESLAPAALFDLLNRFLDTMSAEIEVRGGIIDKYIGDEIMALFGAPLDMPDAPDRAVQAALAMHAALPALNAALAAEGRPTLDFGVGICTARVLAGNVGTHRRLNYSVIGDGVNQAARLQSLTRREDWHASILISEATRDALAQNGSDAPIAYRLRELGEVPLKGRTEPVHVYAVDGIGR